MDGIVPSAAKVMKFRMLTCGMLYLGILLVISSVFGYPQDNSHHQDVQPSFYCYTCMSDNVPTLSKGVLKGTINLPENAESLMCNGPLPLDSSKSIADHNIKLEQCNTACVKVESENKYLKLVIRGCYDKLYSVPGSDLALDATENFEDICDRQAQDAAGIGDTATETCLCTSNYCNGVERTVRISILFLAFMIVYVMLMI